MDHYVGKRSLHGYTYFALDAPCNGDLVDHTCQWAILDSCAAHWGTGNLPIRESRATSMSKNQQFIVLCVPE